MTDGNVDSVSIFGYASTPDDDPYFKEVFTAAKLLAEAGYTVVQGGGTGLMRAAGQGAKAGGGRSIGVTFYPNEEEGLLHENFEGRDPENPIDEEIITKSYLERTLTLMDQGDVFVVFNGGTGTVSEFGMAWGLAKIHFGHHKPLILYGKWWHDIMETFAQHMFIRDTAMKVYTIVDTPEEVVEAVGNVCEHHEHFSCNVT